MLSAVHQLLRTLRGQEHIGQVRQCGRVLHDPDDAQGVRGDLDLIADAPPQRGRHRHLVGSGGCTSLADGGHTRTAFRSAEDVDIARRSVEGRGAPGVRQGSGRFHAGCGGDAPQFHGRERRRPDEGARCAGLDDELVDTERGDRTLGLGLETVG